MKLLTVLFLSIAIILSLSGCDILDALAPIPDETPNIEVTEIVVTHTPLPELGELSALDSAYCWQQRNDAHELEFNVIRFFPDGLVLMVNVKGYDSCEETWEYIKPYLDEKSIDIYSHGEYKHSNGQLRFMLSPPNSDEIAGEASGVIIGNELMLTLQGTEKTYKLVYGGGKDE